MRGQRLWYYLETKDSGDRTKRIFVSDEIHRKEKNLFYVRRQKHEKNEKVAGSRAGGGNGAVDDGMRRQR
jgi:hypothetical protein